ncbi:RNA polymerase sigma factor region1.1 domain-containing protein [Desulfosporosinus sp. SYSU MS00001]|uniref:RNA polymerase sigma factor region1.1 domain-containing protein n=1 Tax=Desulfosporosinus sp. SYSU MS00001 TaxID=3416284 RepID=UPI003CE6E148
MRILKIVFSLFKGVTMKSNAEKKIDYMIRNKNEIVAYEVSDKEITLIFYDGDELGKLIFSVGRNGNIHTDLVTDSIQYSKDEILKIVEESMDYEILSVDELIEKGLKQGSLKYHDVANTVESNNFTLDETDELYQRISEMGIDVLP